MIRILIILSILYLASCSVKNASYSLKNSDSVTQTPEELRRDNIPHIYEEEEIKGIGLITFKDFPASMKVYNEDGSVWKNLFSVDKSSPFFRLVSGIEPRVSAPGYERLLFDCTKIKGDRYEVIVNDSSGLKKYLHMDSHSSFVFETWDKFISQVIPYDPFHFDPITNPPRKSPDQSSKIINLENDEDILTVTGVKMKGDWMKIQTYDEPFRYGWIKWRKDNRVILDFCGSTYPLL
jgi:hypothetical protein